MSRVLTESFAPAAGEGLCACKRQHHWLGLLRGQVGQDRQQISHWRGRPRQGVKVTFHLSKHAPQPGLMHHRAALLRQLQALESSSFDTDLAAHLLLAPLVQRRLRSIVMSYQFCCASFACSNSINEKQSSVGSLNSSAAHLLLAPVVQNRNSSIVTSAAHLLRIFCLLQ